MLTQTVSFYNLTTASVPVNLLCCHAYPNGKLLQLAEEEILYPDFCCHAYPNGKLLQRLCGDRGQW